MFSRYAGVDVGPLNGRAEQAVLVVLGDVQRESILIVGNGAQLPITDGVVPPPSITQKSLALTDRKNIGTGQYEAIWN